MNRESKEQRAERQGREAADWRANPYHPGTVDWFSFQDGIAAVNGDTGRPREADDAGRQ